MSKIIEKNGFSIQPKCISCKNYVKNLTCLAFGTIPDEILLNKNNHSEPLPNQGNEIIFEPIENDK